MRLDEPCINSHHICNDPYTLDNFRDCLWDSLSRTKIRVSGDFFSVPPQCSATFLCCRCRTTVDMGAVKVDLDSCWVLVPVGTFVVILLVSYKPSVHSCLGYLYTAHVWVSLHPAVNSTNTTRRVPVLWYVCFPSSIFLCVDLCLFNSPLRATSSFVYDICLWFGCTCLRFLKSRYIVTWRLNFMTGSLCFVIVGGSWYMSRLVVAFSPFYLWGCNL